MSACPRRASESQVERNDMHWRVAQLHPRRWQLAWRSGSAKGHGASIPGEKRLHRARRRPRSPAPVAICPRAAAAHALARADDPDNPESGRNQSGSARHQGPDGESLPTGLKGRIFSRSAATDRLQCSQLSPSKSMLTTTRRAEGESSIPIRAWIWTPDRNASTSWP